MRLFGSRAREDRASRRTQTDRVAAWALSAGNFAEGTVVRASEIVCADPLCPGIETVLLVMEPDRPTRAVKLGGPAADVTQEDVASALR